MPRDDVYIPLWKAKFTRIFYESIKFFKFIPSLKNPKFRYRGSAVWQNPKVVKWLIGIIVVRSESDITTGWILYFTSVQSIITIVNSTLPAVTVELSPALFFLLYWKWQMTCSTAQKLTSLARKFDRFWISTPETQKFYLARHKSNGFLNKFLHLLI